MRYCTIITAELKQDAPLSYGGNRPHEQVDLPFARDGQGRPVIRGSALAGTFIHHARKLIKGKLPEAITLDSDKRPDERHKRLSSWRFEHAHLLLNQNQTLTPQFHQHVSIHPDTGASREDHLYSQESIPAGNCWGLIMSIWPDDEGQIDTVEALALRTLSSWASQGFRIGRGSGHGYGWMHIENIHIWRLGQAHASLWPNALEVLETPQQINTYLEQAGLNPDTLENEQPNHAPDSITLQGLIDVNEETEGYGLNTLSIGTHAQLNFQTDWICQKVLNSHGEPWNEKKNSSGFDFIIHTEPDSHNPEIHRPVIPGSAIRGVLRAAMIRWQQQLNFQDADAADCIDWLFGSTEHAGALKVANAYLAPEQEQWYLLWQQHIAIDELSGGALEGAKFDRLALANARFSYRLVIEPVQGQLKSQCIHALKQLIQTLGEKGQLPLGGGVWKGHGWVRWHLEEE